MFPTKLKLLFLKMYRLRGLMAEPAFQGLQMSKALKMGMLLIWQKAQVKALVMSISTSFRLRSL